MPISYTSQYPPVQSDDYVKATTKVHVSYSPFYATDPTKLLIGSGSLNSWMSQNYVLTNQRFHIDLGSIKTIRRIYYENFHHNGDLTDTGDQNFTFWGSNTEASFLELTYGIDTGWIELTVNNNNKFDRHIDENQPDPKYILVTNAIVYRYYAFKFANNYGSAYNLGVRRVELQTEDDWPPIKDTSRTGIYSFKTLKI